MKAIPGRVLSDMAAMFDTSAERLGFLGGGREDSDGTVYAYEQGGRPYALKILAIPAGERERALTRITARLRFAHFLGESGVRIAFPLPRRDGTLLGEVPDDGDLYLGYRMDRFFGSPGAGAADSPADLAEYGRLIGRAHRCSRSYPVWWNMTDGEPTAAPGWAEELDGFRRFCEDPEVRACWSALRAEFSRLPANRRTHGFIHNDTHDRNIIRDGSGPVLLDFDVANCQFFMTDVMIAGQGTMFARSGGIERPLTDPEPLKVFYDGFLGGYEQESHLDSEWLFRLDLFVQYRRALLFTVMQEFLKGKPELRESWKRTLSSPPRIAERIFRA